MGYIIPLIIIIFSIAGIFYIVVKRARSLAHEEGGGLVYPDFGDRAESGNKKDPSTRGHEKKEYPEFLRIFNIKEDDTFFIFTEKFIRRMRVRLMRIENWLGSLTNRLREKNRQKREGGGRGPANPDLTGRGGGASFISLHAQGGAFDEQYWLGILKQDPQSSYPYKKLGEIYIAREDFHEARSVLKHALQFDPSDKEIQMRMEELRGKKTKKK